jgi:hypothetical protein
MWCSACVFLHHHVGVLWALLHMLSHHGRSYVGVGVGVGVRISVRALPWASFAVRAVGNWVCSGWGSVVLPLLWQAGINRVVIGVADAAPLKSAEDAVTAAKLLSTSLPCRPWPASIDLCHWAAQLKVLHHPAHGGGGEDEGTVGAGAGAGGGGGGGGKKKHGRKGKGGKR